MRRECERSGKVERIRRKFVERVAEGRGGVGGDREGDRIGVGGVREGGGQERQDSGVSGRG